MNKKRLFITNAIPYVNAPGHLGHALEFVQTDTLARFYRQRGYDVFYLSGADENALKNVQAAEKEGIPVKKLVDKYTKQFQKLRRPLNLSYDGFIRTTEKKHFKGAQKFWLACKKDIYKKTYQGRYCVGCEEFKTKKELIDDKCPEHPNQKLEFVEEENYFFALSRYQKQLEQLIGKDKLKITPKERKNEVLSFIKSGLKDFSISRSLKRAKGWGIPVPGDKSQIIYVWFDAVINYITGLGYADNDKLFKKFWLNNPNILQCIGKGIIRFHAVYWPAMLLSAGLPLPTEEFVHGYITIEGKKISKSLGNVIDPFALVEKYGTDTIRYYLLKEIHPFQDGDFNIEHFEEVYNANLANGLGNLVQRVAKLAEKTSLGDFKNKKTESHPGIESTIKTFEFHRALELIWQNIASLDKYIDKTKPWKKAGKDLERILERPIKELLVIAYLLKPFLPETARKIEKIFTAKRIQAPEKPLFPRI